MDRPREQTTLTGAQVKEMETFWKGVWETEGHMNQTTRRSENGPETKETHAGAGEQASH